MSTPLKADRKASFSRLGLHMGEAFCRIASDYPTILDVTLEQVQNAIDANARTVWVVLNRKTRQIAIRDDGDGRTQAEFEEAILEVCRSRKERTKLGRFGIGLVSPLGKCEFSTFTSAPRNARHGYMEWTFRTEDIRRQSVEPVIPVRARAELCHSARRGGVPRGETGVLWKTEVCIHKYSRDKMISRIDSIDALADEILSRFGEAMRRHKVVLNLKFTNEDGTEEVREGVRAKQFKGRAIGTIVIRNEDAGAVTFTLFLAPATTKGINGKVGVGEADNDFSFGFNLFARSATGIVSEAAAAALLSGIFEGTIRSERVKLHSTRTSFEKDAAFVGFCTAIDEWYARHGAKHIEKEKEAGRDERYQKLGKESLQEIEAMLKDPAFSDILKVLDFFKVGSVGKGHAPRPDSAIVGAQEHPSITTQDPPPSEGGEGEGGSGGDPRADRPSHHPFTAMGPRGKPRTLVKRDSIGLQFSYIAMDGSDRLWELDAKCGILHFNINHETWVACDGSDRKIRQLQETVAVYALMIQAMPDETAEILRFAFDESLRPLTHLFHSSPAFKR